MPTRAVRNGGRSFHFLSPYTKLLRLSAERKLCEQFRTMVRAPVLSLPLFIYILRSCLIPQFLGHTRAGRYIRSWDVVGKSLEAARRTRDSRFCEFHNQRSFQVVPCSTVPRDDVSLFFRSSLSSVPRSDYWTPDKVFCVWSQDRPLPLFVPLLSTPPANMKRRCSFNLT